MGIEPTSHPWEGRILPVNYTREFVRSSRRRNYTITLRL